MDVGEPLCESPSARPATPHASGAVPPTRRPVSRYCPFCGYQLDGLPSLGACPECGLTYRQQTIQTRPLPTAREIIARFSWPVIVFGLVVTITYSGWIPGLGGMGLFIGLVSFVTCYANIPLQMHLLRRSGVLMSGAPPAPHDYWIAIMIIAALGAPIMILLAVASGMFD